MEKLRGVAVGAGYFSAYHLDAWLRMPDVHLAAICDVDEARARQAQERFGLPRFYVHFEEMLEREQPAFVDVITPPASRLALCTAAAGRGIHLICQKPLAPTLALARQLVDICSRARVRCMVHENFRFQPWHRQIKRLLTAGSIGDRLHTLTFRSRLGDGWGSAAYLGRQPYFREMPRFLIHETGVHFIDTFRYLAGEVVCVHALLRKLNPEIAGEDCGILLLEFACGAIGLWDANRFNESSAADPRLTFGEFLVEGNGGAIRLMSDGTLTLQPLGGTEHRLDYEWERRGFAGDCVHAAQRHFIDRLVDGGPFETDAASYLENLVVEEAAYESAARGQPVVLRRDA